MNYNIHNDDCLIVLPKIDENHFDAIITDPPYELGFMGKNWDSSGVAFDPATWAKAYRVLKPGGHLVAFGAPKNYHRLACAIEDAGFELRDSLMWVFGTGFPKSLDVSKAIDATILHGGSHSRMIKKAIADRPGEYRETATLPNNGVMSGDRKGGGTKDEAATDQAREWQGWGTALKPAYEPIVLARKPFSEKTVAANVLRWGTGALNIDACRISAPDGVPKFNKRNETSENCFGDGLNGSNRTGEMDTTTGRWPANLCHDGSQGVLDLFPHTKSGSGNRRPNGGGNYFKGISAVEASFEGDSGSAARFFYSAKASKHDRVGSKHPTVKPVSLMQWLVRMITPPGGIILDPFAGTGTTAAAAILEGFDFVLIEREAEYVEDIKRRIHSLTPEQEVFEK